MVTKYGAADHVTTMGFVTSTAVQSILESMAENRTLHNYVVNVMTPQAAELAVEIGVSPDVELYNNSARRVRFGMRVFQFEQAWGSCMGP